MALYGQLLLFPERAENLNDRFSAYDVELTHWSGLSEAFRRAFQAVFVRGSSAILLVHGAQGMGKTLFTQRPLYARMPLGGFSNLRARAETASLGPSGSC